MRTRFFDFCRKRVEEMIRTAKLQHSGDQRQPSLPLIRLRLEYNDESQQFHSAQFGAQFNGRVANHSEIISYVKRKENHSYEDEQNFDFNEFRDLLNEDVIEQRVNIKDIIREYFERIPPHLQLGLLSEQAMTAAVIELVEKDSNEAIADVFEDQKSRMKQSLLEIKDLEIGDIDQMKEQIKALKQQNGPDFDVEDFAQILAKSRNKSKSEIKKEDNNFDSDSDTNNQMDVESEEEEKIKFWKR